jgi:hypothetical protein
MEIEEGNAIIFLDLTIRKLGNKHVFNIYRKDTCTDIVIPVDSVHPWSHKLAAFNSMIHRALTVPMQTKDLVEEMNCIIDIGKANGYREETIKKVWRKHVNKKNIQSASALIPPCTEPRNQWVTIPYIGPISDRIARNIRKPGIKVAFQSIISLKSLLSNTKDKIEPGKKVEFISYSVQIVMLYT